MSARLIAWSLALVAGLVVGSLISDSVFPGSRLVGFASTIVLSLAIARLTLRRRVRPVDALDNRLPDGRIDLARIEGVNAEPNPFDARFGRFLSVASPPAVDRSSIGRREARIVGRCPRLIGRVVILSVFLDKDRNTWPDEEIARSHQAIVRAGEWMEREALRWNARMNVEVGESYFLAPDGYRTEVEIEFQYESQELGTFEKDEIQHAFASLTSAAISLRFPHAVAMIETIEARIDADVVIWLLHPRSAGRSFAIPVDLPIAGSVHLALCYPVYSDLPEPFLGPAVADPVTLAHEIFHLFGAADKYNQPIRAFEPGTVTRSDVMRLDEGRLTRLRVDRQTAREVGWIS